jgi:hypothetical protein
MVPGEHPGLVPARQGAIASTWVHGLPRSLLQSVRLLLRAASNAQTLWMALGGVT